MSTMVFLFREGGGVGGGGKCSTSYAALSPANDQRPRWSARSYSTVFTGNERSPLRLILVVSHLDWRCGLKGRSYYAVARAVVCT